MSLLSFLFSCYSGGKGGGRAVLKSCLLLGEKTYVKINCWTSPHHSSRDSSNNTFFEDLVTLERGKTAVRRKAAKVYAAHELKPR